MMGDMLSGGVMAPERNSIGIKIIKRINIAWAILRENSAINRPSEDIEKQYSAATP